MACTGSRRRIALLARCVAVGLAVAGAPAALAAAREEGVESLGPFGTPGTGTSTSPDLSAGGRFVAFATVAGDLIPGDERGEQCSPGEPGTVVCQEVADIVVRDRATRTNERVSVSSDEVPGDGDSGGISLAGPAISADGRYVAFGSDARNLVPGDADDDSDVFVRDRVAGTTERVSVTSRGAEGSGDSGGYGVAISRDGRFVAFETYAEDLAPGGRGVMVHDRVTRETTRVGHDGQSGVELSGDGRVVVFATIAPGGPRDTDDGQDVFAHDRTTGKTEMVSVDDRGRPRSALNDGFNPAVSGSGRFVVFTSQAALSRRDKNRASDVYVRDRRLRTTRRISVKPSGRESRHGSSSSDISSDGRFVALFSSAGLVRGDRGHDQDLFVRDRRSGVTRKLTDGDSAFGSTGFVPARLSPDGGSSTWVEARGPDQVLVRRVPGR